MPYYWYLQKQSSGGVLRKKCYENMEQSYRRIPIPKCDLNTVASNFIEITLRHGCFPINLLHIFRTPFPKNTFGRLLLKYSWRWESGSFKHFQSSVSYFKCYNVVNDYQVFVKGNCGENDLRAYKYWWFTISKKVFIHTLVEKPVK